LIARNAAPTRRATRALTWVRAWQGARPRLKKPRRCAAPLREIAMNSHWILIANATRARLLEQRPDEPLKELRTFEHAAGRSKISELADDRLGSERNDRVYGAAAYQPRMDAKHKEHRRFAHELAEYLERQAQLGAFRKLDVLASNPFLGELKAQWGDTTARLVASTHDVDLTMVGKAEIGRRIAAELAT
jgi:protein required for attachment to host cells